MAAEGDEAAALRAAMARAVAEEDFEAAAALRDRLKALADGGGSRVRRQEPGAMGLGTERPAHVPPPGWVKPQRPDPMTTGAKRGGRRRKP
jgi:hypothetical protein